MNRVPLKQRPGPAKWIILGSGIVAALHLGKVAIAAPMLQADLGIGLVQAGWLTGIFAVLGLFGGAPAGAVAVAIGHRKTLLMGLGFTAAAGVIAAAAPSFDTLLATRLVEGLGFLLIVVAGPAILERLFAGAERDRALSLWSCFMPCGMALAMVIGPAFLTWQWLWWSSSALTAIIAAIAICCIPQDEPLHTQGQPFPGMRQALSRSTTLLAISFALYSLMFFALFAFLPVLLMDRMDVTYRGAGLLSALVSAVNIGGNLAAGYLIARGAGRGALIILASGLMGAAGLGIFTGVFGPVATLMLCFLFSAVGGLIPATLLASAPLSVREATLVPVAVGILMQGSNLGQLLGPIIVGGLTAAHGWGAAGPVVLLAALAACIAVLLLSAVFPSNGQTLWLSGRIRRTS